MTWQEIIAIEPKLLSLETEIKSIKDSGGKSFCANTIWYNQFKQRVVDLVGDYASNEQLRSQQAYSLAYHHLYDQLPNCRNCNCA